MGDDPKDIAFDLMYRHRYIVETPKGKFRFVCAYKFGCEFPDGYYACPNNEAGICLIEHDKIPWHEVHIYNGRKMWKCPCG